MKNLRFPEFCSQAFLCCWNKAIVNIVLLFALSVVFVNAGKRAGVLFSPSDLTIDLVTGVVVTILIVGLGFLRKSGYLVTNSRD